MRLPSVEESVQRGVAALDEMFGPGWVLLIDLDTFNIRDGNRCVLGQLHPAAADPLTFYPNRGDSRFCRMHRALSGMNGFVQEHAYALNWTVTNGFDVLMFGTGREERYDALQDEWVRVIRERQNQYPEGWQERVAERRAAS